MNELCEADNKKKCGKTQLSYNKNNESNNFVCALIY